ncbi:MAG TPA: PQQ-binding-like beta-propeller repeat protein [Blastocatellia bacterium]|nr:PQQ-binding-like beta-propeller repeat protein [Blastocatellia bacterium]
MRFKPVWVAAALGCLLLPVQAQNWPSFRGPNASGVSEGKSAPTKWDAEKTTNIAWKVPIPGLAHSSPVVWEDQVFITTAVSSDPKSYFRAGLYGDVDSAEDISKHSWRVYCLEKKTGRILWERVAHEGIPKTKRHIKSTFANATPVTDGRHLIAFFGAEGLFCYDLKGNLKWKQDLGVLDGGWFFDPDYQWGTASSPIIYKDLVIVQCDVQKDSFIAAYQLKDGKEVWRTPRQEIPSWGSPTIVESKNRVELVTNATKAVRGYDPLTGKEIWKLIGNPEVTATTPVAAHGLIFICNSYRPNQPIYAIKQGVATGDISLATGQTSNDFVAWSLQRGGSYMPTPVVYGDYLYVCSNAGIISVYDAKTGIRAYMQRLAEKGGSFSASPVAADGKLYFASEDGEVVVVKAGPKYELLSVNPMGEVLMATPAISDGIIIVRGQKHVFGVIEKAAEPAKSKTSNQE